MFCSWDDKSDKPSRNWRWSESPVKEIVQENSKILEGNSKIVEENSKQATPLIDSNQRTQRSKSRERSTRIQRKSRSRSRSKSKRKSKKRSHSRSKKKHKKSSRHSSENHKKKKKKRKKSKDWIKKRNKMLNLIVSIRSFVNEWIYFRKMSLKNVIISKSKRNAIIWNIYDLLKWWMSNLMWKYLASIHLFHFIIRKTIHWSIIQL